MTLGGIASPIDNEVSSILYFAQRARDLATQLSGDFGGTVSQTGVTVEQPTHQVR